ncbi:hypothetical protein SEA_OMNICRITICAL_4 [Mycobacterium phage OmniCritical]|nr:hypothetical protein SEA_OMNICRITICAL_4 [Mycobacterium phage OmniCritical]
MSAIVRFMDPAVPETEYGLPADNFDPATPAGQQALQDAMAAICADPTVVSVEVNDQLNLFMGESLYFYVRRTVYATLQDYFDSLSGGSE